MVTKTIGQLNGFWAFSFKIAAILCPCLMTVTLWAASMLRDENHILSNRVLSLEVSVAAVPKDLISGAEINRRLDALEHKADQVLERVAELAVAAAKNGE